MKKTNRVFYILTVIAVLCCAGFAFSASAAGETYTENGYTYTVNDGTATITAVDDTVAGDAVIPETLGGYTVTKLESAFKDNTNITSVRIPDSINEIAQEAFYGCTNLTEAYLPDSITILPKGLFQNCTQLTYVELPGNLEIISAYAFYNCTSLISIDFPTSLKTIKMVAFDKCKNLSNVVFPDGLQIIDFGAFRSCDSITDVTIPDSVETIGQHAFSCSNLTNIKIGSGVKKMNNAAFDMGSVKSVVVDENNMYYSSDEYGTLFDKNKTVLLEYPCGNERTEYYVPESVIELDIGCFANAKNLSRVVLSEGLQRIGQMSFQASSINTIVIPSTVEYIDDNAFLNCRQLNSIYVNENNLYYSSDENHALYDKDKTILICYPTSATETLYRTPDTLRTIETSAFFYNQNITKIVLSDSVTTIEKGAFVFENAIDVEIGKGLTTIGEQPFASEVNSFKISSKNESFSVGDDGVLYSKDKTKLIKYASSRETDIFIVPKTVEEICQNAFEDVPITNLIFPKEISQVNGRSFYLCGKLKSVVFYNPDVDILNADSAGHFLNGHVGFYIYGYQNSTAKIFSDNYELRFKPICDSVDFENNDSILSLTGTEAIESSDDPKIYPWLPYAEDTEIIVFNGVTQIGSNAFSGFANADTVIVNSENTVIESKAFDGCEKVRTVVSFADFETSADSFPENADITYYIQADKKANIPLVSFFYDEPSKTVIFNGDVSVTSNDFFNLLAAVCYGYQDKEIEKLKFSRFTAEDFQFIYYKSRYETIRKNTIEEAEFTVEIDSENGEKQQISFNELCEGIGNDEITKFSLVATDKDNSNFDNNDVGVGEENIFIRWAKALLALITRIFKLFEKIRK